MFGDAMIENAKNILYTFLAVLWMGCFALEIRFSASGGIFFLLLGIGVIAYIKYTEGQAIKNAQREVEREAEGKSKAEKDAEIKQVAEAQEAKRQQEAMLLAEQARLDDEAMAGRLRGAVNELIDCSNMLGPGTDSAEIVRAMHSTLNNLTSRYHDLKPHYFDDEMLQYDIRLIIKRLQQAGLQDDLIVERLIKVLRQDIPTQNSLEGSTLHHTESKVNGSGFRSEDHMPSQERPVMTAANSVPEIVIPLPSRS
jgi:hypothetical protein